MSDDIKNKFFPALKNYVGPNSGWFSFVLSHELYGGSNDIQKRIKDIKKDTPKDKIDARLKKIVYIGECPEMVTIGSLYNDCVERISDEKKKVSSQITFLRNSEYKNKPVDTIYNQTVNGFYAECGKKSTSIHFDYSKKAIPLAYDVLKYVEGKIKDLLYQENRKSIFGSDDYKDIILKV